MTMNHSEIHTLINEIKMQLSTLPFNEITYYMNVLLASIKNGKNPERHIELLQKTIPLINAVRMFYDDPENIATNIEAVNQAINTLISVSNMKTLPHTIKRALFGICGAIMAILAGVTLGFSGLLVGVFSNYTIIGNIRGAGLGFLSGLAIGILIGSRCPTKLFQSTIDTKVEFCCDNILRLQGELTGRKTIQQYELDTKKYIQDTFFKDTSDKEEAFNNFLINTQKFQVCTKTAGHVSKQLKGHLGHHTLIRFSINNVTDLPIEFGDRNRTPKNVDQSEKYREVSGQVLFKMLSLDRMLQETHESNITNGLRIYDIGSDDCRTYVDKILLGTGQDPTKIGRFNPKNDSIIGRKVVGPLIGFFSKTNETDLHGLIDNPNDPKFEIMTHNKQG